MARSSFGLGLGLGWSLVAAAALIACGGAQPAPATPGEPGAAPESEASGADLKWSDDLPVKDKGVFMKKKVLPEMSKIFKEFDAKTYEKFSCKTCHGPQMKPKPVDFLPELHMKDGKLVEAAEHGDIAKFMGEKVSPGMADLFGKPHYDPATNQGFGCGGCHKMNM
jgi:hypothetical protein